MNQDHPTFWELLVKSVVTHTVTYFIMGLLASTIFDYTALYANTSLNLLMRQLRDPWVMAGPLFQRRSEACCLVSSSTCCERQSLERRLVG